MPNADPSPQPPNAGDTGPIPGGPSRLHGGWMLGAAACELGQRQIAELQRRLDALGPGASADAVHRLRVACRRLRCLLADLLPLAPRKKPVRRARKALAALAAAVGSARELDVEAKRLTRRSERAGPVEEAALRWLWATNRRQRLGQESPLANARQGFLDGGGMTLLGAVFEAFGAGTEPSPSAAVGDERPPSQPPTRGATRRMLGAARGESGAEERQLGIFGPLPAPRDVAPEQEPRS